MTGVCRLLSARLSDVFEKRYWIQVDGQADSKALVSLINGVNLKDGPASATYASVIPPPGRLWTRDPPIRVRKRLPTEWLEIVVSEGRNRQVRRMSAAVGLPTLRLIRHAIGPWSLGGLQPGESRQLSTRIAWQQLNDHATKLKQDGAGI